MSGDARVESIAVHGPIHDSRDRLVDKKPQPTKLCRYCAALPGLSYEAIANVVRRDGDPQGSNPGLIEVRLALTT
jgi:hypothetical protein